MRTVYLRMAFRREPMVGATKHQAVAKETPEVARHAPEDPKAYAAIMAAASVADGTTASPETAAAIGHHTTPTEQETSTRNQTITVGEAAKHSATANLTTPDQ